MVTHATFSRNTANNGGGMSNFNTSSPTLTHVTFSRNTSTIGGGMSNFNASSPHADPRQLLRKHRQQHRRGRGDVQ